MFTVTASVLINKPLHQLFQFMLDGNNYPKWIPMLKPVNAHGPFIERMQFEEVSLFQRRGKIQQRNNIENGY